MADPDPTANKAPAFQFYPADFLGDGNQASMSLAECGAYIRLICACWTTGSIPNDLERVARIVSTTPKQMEKLWPAVRACFRERDDGRLVHGRLERERIKQLHWAEKSAAGGRRSQAKRKGGLKMVAECLQPKADSSSSSSSSSSDLLTQKSAREKEPTTTPERAGAFCQWYEDTHQRLFSVGYMGTGHDYQKACELVAKFTDAELHDGALVWFGMDDDFATNGTRSIPKFASRITGCLQLARAKGIA